MKERKKSAESKERKERSTQGDTSHKKNWKEYMATVEDIQRSTSGRFASKELHHGQDTAATQCQCDLRSS